MKTIKILICLLAILLLHINASNLFAGDPMAPENITITQADGKWKIAGPTMEAFVESDGCMSRLRLPYPGEWWDHVPNYIKTGIGLPKERPEGGSNGAFFLQNGAALNLSDIKKDGDNVIVAQNQKAEIRYEFSNTQQLWTVSNKTDAEMQFLIVFDGSVNAIEHADYGFKPTPVNQFWEDVTFYQGKRRLAIKGLSRLWAPGPLIGMNWSKGFFQVCEVTLSPKSTKEIVLNHGVATEEEQIAVEAIAESIPARGAGPKQMSDTKAAVDGQLTILSPQEFQVFQRKSRFEGNIFLAGSIVPKIDQLQFRIIGKSLKGELKGNWQELSFEKIRQTFASYVPCVPGGWYQIEIRALKDGKTVAEAAIDNVGLGEVFVGCGQSNSTNYGSKRTNTETGMVSTFSGSEWRIANDPQPGTHDHSTRGSFWPSFGDAMNQKYQVPIGVAATGRGGAPVRNWNPGTPSFIWTMTRILQLGPNGFRAVLWHQGETDYKVSADYYFDSLGNIIKASHAVAKWDFPWFVAQVSYRNPKESSFPNIRAGQKRLWDTGIALEGPDTDTLVGDDRGGIHLSEKGLKNHGKMWAEKVSVYLDKVLEE